MGRGRTYLQADQGRASGPAGGRRRRSEHPLLQLQRTAGNRAVAGLIVQRREKKYFSSVVAVALPEVIYGGKCDAKLEGASVRKKWSRGLTGKDTSLIFECGPKSFEFETFRPWFGDRFPWSMDAVDGSSAWVMDPISQALDDISDDIDDAGSKFWSGYHTIKAGLASDLKNFCAD